MKLAFSLGVFGPWQIIFLLIVLALVVGVVLLIVFLVAKNAVKNTSASPKTDHLDQLDRLNKLKQSGALTEVEFETEKRKILGNS